MKKPTIEQIQEVIDTRGYLLDAEQFFCHYEAIGWKIGKSPMKDWKCALTTWFIRGGRKKKMQAPQHTPHMPDSARKWLMEIKTADDIKANASFMALLSNPSVRAEAIKINPLVGEVR